MATINICAQKNEFGLSDRFSFYRSVDASPSYNKKYTIESASAMEWGLYYKRFFKEGTRDLTLSIDFTERNKYVIQPVDPYTIAQYFNNFELMYHTNFPITERISIGYGAGLYFATGSEEWKFADTAKDTTVREDGINILGLSIDVPITVNTHKN